MLGENVFLVVRGTCPVATRNGTGLRTRLRSLGIGGEGRVIRHVGVTEDCKSLSRGSRCRSTGSRRTFIRNHVAALRGVVHFTRVVRIRGISASVISLKHGIAFIRLPSNSRRACVVINDTRTSPLRNGVSGSSPVTGTLLNGRVNRRIIVNAPNNSVGIGVIEIRRT